MVRVIYITKTNDFVCPEKHIQPLSEFCYGYVPNNKNIVACFEDYTSNFVDLNYWNSEDDLHNKPLSDVLNQLSNAISNLEKDNIEPIVLTPEEEDSFLLPNWWFGRTQINNSIFTKDIEDNNMRKSILLFHLINLYKALINKYDQYTTQMTYLD